MSAVLALLASALWGTADFSGGLLARRYPVPRVVLCAQGLALAAMLVVVSAAGAWRSAPGPLLWGLAAGLVGLGALAAFYRALSTGVMGLVAPIAATGVLVPVVVGVLRGERPSAVQVLGIVLAALGVVVASRPAEGDTTTPVPRLRPLLLAGVAAVGFGLVLVFVAAGSRGRHGSVGMTLLTMRAAAVVVLAPLVLLLSRHRDRAGVGWPVHRGDALPLLAASAFDLTANGLYAVATRGHLVSVTAVLASLYPVATVLLAWRVLGERLDRRQAAAVTGMLAGVVLLAAG